LAVEGPIEVTLDAAVPIARQQRVLPPRGDGGLPCPTDGDERDDLRAPGFFRKRIRLQGVEVGENFLASLEDAGVVLLRELAGRGGEGLIADDGNLGNEFAQLCFVFEFE
jgi:hypothetical protein